MALIQGVASEPFGIQLWIGWLFLINLAAAAFLPHRTARLALIALAANCLVEVVIAEAFGYDVRLLGLSHIAIWTPLLAHLWRSRIGGSGLVARWQALVTVSIAASLAIDYVNAARLLAG